MTTPCMAGALSFAVRSLPQPPSVGVLEFRLDATNTAGAPVTGLEIGVVPWMPSMRHGSPVPPSVTDMGDGSYLVENVDLTMVGDWQLQLTLSGAMSGSCNLEFSVAPSPD
jgi:hypothetical protein